MLTVLGLYYRDATLITLYFVVLRIRMKSQKSEQSDSYITEKLKKRANCFTKKVNRYGRTDGPTLIIEKLCF